METLSKELLENHNTIKLFNYLRNVKHDDFLKDLSNYVYEQKVELIEQTTKLQADKDRLASVLKKRLAEINEMPNHIAEFCSEEKLEITKTLSDCGYNI